MANETTKQKKSHSEVIISKIDEWANNDIIKNSKEFKAFKELIKKNAIEINKRTGAGFNEMAMKRSALKYYGWTKKQFDEAMSLHYENELKKFELAQTFTPEVVEEIKKLNKSITDGRIEKKKAREAKENQNNEGQNFIEKMRNSNN